MSQISVSEPECVKQLGGSNAFPQPQYSGESSILHGTKLCIPSYAYPHIVLEIGRPLRVSVFDTSKRPHLRTLATAAL